RRRHTRSTRDWSSDVCSSDLRAYQTVPIQPDQVLKEMWENPRRGYDPVIVKAFINLIGIYPVGTCVILDIYEVAIVHSANPDVKIGRASCGGEWRSRRRRSQK